MNVQDYYLCCKNKKTGGNMNHILHNKLETLKELCLRYKVKSLYAFGSVNTPRFTENSDIDLLIEFEPDIPLRNIQTTTSSCTISCQNYFEGK